MKRYQGVKMKLLMLITISAFISVAGCANVAPAQTANKLDLKKAYIDELAKKYSPATNGQSSRFSQLIDEYNLLPEKRVGLENEIRKVDLDKKSSLEDQLDKLKQSLANSQGALVKYQAYLSAEEAGLKELQDSLVALAAENKSSNAQSSDSTVDQINAIKSKIQNKKFGVSELKTRIEMTKPEIDQTRVQIESINMSLKALYGITYPDPVERRRREIRKEVADDLMSISDHNFIEFKDSLLSGRAGSDTALDISELLISTATTLTGGVAAKTNLGAASTLLKGSRASIDKNFFAQSTLAAIINAVESTRLEDRKMIIAGLSGDTDKYSLQQAISDIERYDSRANLLFAVLEITNQTGAKLKEETPGKVDALKASK